MLLPSTSATTSTPREKKEAHVVTSDLWLLSGYAEVPTSLGMRVHWKMARVSNCNAGNLLALALASTSRRTSTCPADASAVKEGGEAGAGQMGGGWMRWVWMQVGRVVSGALHKGTRRTLGEHMPLESIHVETL